MADLCCKAERLVGTLGGGMDQAAALMSREGAALHVQFQPSLAATEVTFWSRIWKAGGACCQSTQTQIQTQTHGILRGCSHSQ